MGNTVITTAAKLKYQNVIYAVGPRWEKGEETTKLTNALQTQSLTFVLFNADSFNVFKGKLEQIEK